MSYFQAVRRVIVWFTKILLNHSKAPVWPVFNQAQIIDIGIKIYCIIFRLYYIIKVMVKNDIIIT